MPQTTKSSDVAGQPHATTDDATGSATGPAHPAALIESAVASHRRRIAASGPVRASPPDPATDTPRPLGAWIVVCGVIWPATVIAVELVTHVCAENFFDPIPTPWHVGLVALAPLVNLIVWWQMSGAEANRRLHPRRRALLLGLATGVGAFYALLFVPVLPFAIVLLVIGFGLLPLGPAAGLVVTLSLLRRTLRTQTAGRSPLRPFLAGLAAAAAAVVALDVPQALTRHGLSLAADADPDTRARGIAFLRTWGDRGELLALCYPMSRRPAGPLALLMALGESRPFPPVAPPAPIAAAREAYYLVTGRPFNTEPLPQLTGVAKRWRGARIFDGDLAGTEVGGAVPGLSLATSRLDGVIDGTNAVAYLEWVFEMRNDATRPAEARMTVALPPGGVVSRVTLWVDGVEQDAAFAGRAQVRQAYERVVRRAQDPFLVTTRGAGRVLAQAFPVPAGGSMRFKIGITAPVGLDSAASGHLVLPAVIDRNFAIGTALKQAVWLDSRQPLSASVPGLERTTLGGGGTRLTGTLDVERLARARPVIRVTRDPGVPTMTASNPDTGAAMQEIVMAPPLAAGPLLLVIDASARTRPHTDAVLTALGALPEGLPVGFAIAGQGVQLQPPEPWSPAAQARLAAALRAEPHLGGADNTEALARALIAAGDAPGAQVLWIHGPQPVRFARSKARLEQIAARLHRPPQLHLYALEPGPNALLVDAPWTAAADTIPATGDVAADLARALRVMTGAGPHLVVRRHLTSPGDEPGEPWSPTPPAAAHGSAHVVRLAALDAVNALLARPTPTARAAALEIAARHRLVTPVSGAVVLETARQYRDAGLTPGSQVPKGVVPTVPEPHECALIVLAALMLGWLAWGRRSDRDESLGAAA